VINLLSKGLKNRLKYWRYESKMERKQFANFLEVNYNQYCKWENQFGQPSTQNLYCMWEKLKELFPDIHIEDLVEKRV
jgi:DNA-binding XRE family transcriptional regulator